MDKLAKLVTDIGRLWENYSAAYVTGIQNTLILAVAATVAGCLIGLICGVLNTIPYIPVSLFEIDTLTPGITVFGLSFLTLFSATLVAKDRETALLQRLYTTPLTGFDFILGYMLPILPIAMGQAAVCYLFAIPLGLTISINIVYAVVGILPMAIFNIALGLLCGSVLGVKQVGGICGALLTNLSAWLSGVWFDLELVGGFFEKIAHALPFFHAVEMEQALFHGDFQLAATHFVPVLLYSILITVVAVFSFLEQMKKQ